MTETLESVMQAIQNDINSAKDRIEQHWSRIRELQPEYDRLFDEYVTSGEEENKEFERASRAINREYGAISALKDRIQRLESPLELDNRMHKQEKLQTLKRRYGMATKTDNSNVPTEYLNESGRFRTGMDARYKSDLVHSALGLESKDALKTFSAKDAEKRLEERGWTKFLDRKRELLAEKEQKAEERAAAKAEREKEKAAEKQRKAQEKEAAKAESVSAPASAAGTNVVPDPKPSKSKGGMK